jgi:thiamine biosynthesis protein ThiS
MTSGPSITITVNGESRSAPAGSTVHNLLLSLDLDPARLAVEYNRAILRKSEWPTQVLDDGDKLEIVEFVGGG